jgi:hypothetical protein
LKKVFQTILGTEHGNCLQACLASILELPLEDCVDVNDSPDELWFEDLQRWLAEFGLSPILLPFDFNLRMAFTDGVFYRTLLIAIGDVRGRPHACVFKGDILVHDPHPQRNGFDSKPTHALFFCALDPARFIDRSSDASEAAPGGSGDLKGKSMKQFATKGLSAQGVPDGTVLTEGTDGTLSASLTAAVNTASTITVVTTVTIPVNAENFDDYVEVTEPPAAQS